MSQKTRKPRRKIIRSIATLIIQKVPSKYIDELGYYRYLGTDRLVHRDIYEKAHGKVKDGSIVHHIDCSKLNNDLSNLIELTEAFHNYLHHKMRLWRCLLNRNEILELNKVFKLQMKRKYG